MKSSARIFTLAVDAGFEGRAIGIGPTSDVNVDTSTSRLWCALESWRAVADCCVVERFTFLFGSASIWHGTRIGTNAIEASSIRRTILQVGTANGLASGVGIAFGSRRALADWFVLKTATDGSAFTSGW